MSTVTSPLEKEMNASEYMEIKKETVETSFKKYDHLPSESRTLVLDYVDLQTLKNYSEISHCCNAEFQRFKTNPPAKVVLLENDDGIFVRIGCTYQKNYQVEKNFNFSDKTNIMEDIKQYLIREYKYVVDGSSTCVHINMKTWPKEIFEIKQIAEAHCWVIHTNTSMYSSFLDWSKSTDIQLHVLNLRKDEASEDQVEVGADFFKSEVGKQVRNLTVSPSCRIDHDDFMNFSNDSLHVNSWIDIDTIRKKVLNMNNLDKTFELARLTIEVPKEDHRKYKIRELFPRDQFEVVYNWKDHHYRIGEMVGLQIEDGGKQLSFKLFKFKDELHEIEDFSDEEDDFSDEEEDITDEELDSSDAEDGIADEEHNF